MDLSTASRVDLVSAILSVCAEIHTSANPAFRLDVTLLKTEGTYSLRQLRKTLERLCEIRDALYRAKEINGSSLYFGDI